MRNAAVMFVVCLAASCAGSNQSAQPQTAQELGDGSTKKFASPDLCEQAITSLEKAEDESTTTPKRLFDRTSANIRHRDRVRECTIKLTEKEAACIAEAPSLQYVRECRKFALVQ